MKFWTKVAVSVFFECEQCQSTCIGEDRFGEGCARVFCSNCGACYALYMDVEGNKTVRRIEMGEMYLPPLEWNVIFGNGQRSGQRAETFRRQHYRTFWQRLRDFILNR